MKTEGDAEGFALHGEQPSPFFSLLLVITNEKEEVFRCGNSAERFGSFKLVSLRAARVGRFEKEKHISTLLLKTDRVELLHSLSSFGEKRASFFLKN